MPTRDDDFHPGPSAAENRRGAKRTRPRRHRPAAGNPKDDPVPETSSTAFDRIDSLMSTLQRCGLVASSLPLGERHPLASAGPKLADLRARSGWTVEEIAERTRMSSDLLAAFEAGDSAAAGQLTTFDLERLASACCGTLADLLGPDHSWVKAAHRRESRLGYPSLSFDPDG